MNYKVKRFCNSKAPGLLRVTRNSEDEFRVQGFNDEGLVLDEVVDLDDAQELQDDSEDVILCTDEDGEVEVTILPVNGGEVIEDELEDEGYYEVSNSRSRKTVKNSYSESDTARSVGKMIVDYLRDNYSIPCDINCRENYCIVDILGDSRGMKYNSPYCKISDNTIKLWSDITLGEVADIFAYLNHLPMGMNRRRPR